MQAWFISDIHIKDINERSSVVLLRFLHSLINKERPGTHLIFLGDIFDLWVSDSPVFIRKYQPLVDAIVTLQRMGVKIIYFEGNHDIHVKHFWQDQLQIPTFDDVQIMKIGPYKIRMEHGDFINPAEVNYLRLRAFLRSRVMEKLAPYIAGHALESLGNFASRMSRKRSSAQRERNFENLRSMIRSYAEKVANETDFDLILTGHMHVQDDYSFVSGQGEKCRSINLGSWFDGPKALSISDSEIHFVDLF